jgi:hypothetical protein
MKGSAKRNVVIGIISLVLLSMCVFAFAADHKVNADKHWNLAAAQDLITKAIGKVKDAQKANDMDLGGHGNKAIELLNEAYEQMWLAEKDADKN